MLRPRKRISKREIKEDALVTFYVRVQKVVKQYSKQLNIGFFALLFVIVISVLMIRSKRNAEMTSSSKLGIAEQFYFSMNYQNAIDELLKIVEVYPGTKSAGMAVFYIANSYFELKEFDNAKTYYQNYLEGYKNNKMITASSLAGVAACLEQQSLFLESAGFYERASKKYAVGFKAPFYLKDAGRCYILAGQNEKGKEMAQFLIDKYPDSNLVNEMKFLVESL